MMSNVVDLMNRKDSALIVWDMQEALVNHSFNKAELLTKINQLLEGARSLNIPIFYTKITPLPERYESNIRKSSWRGGKFEPGDIVKEVYPKPNEIVINKNTASIFIGTNFELMVRNAGLSTLVFTGIATEIGVESSARHAQNLGFLAVVAREAVSSSDKDAHDRSLLNIQKLLPVLSNEEILNAWKRK